MSGFFSQQFGWYSQIILLYQKANPRKSQGSGVYHSRSFFLLSPYHTLSHFVSRRGVYIFSNIVGKPWVPNGIATAFTKFIDTLPLRFRACPYMSYSIHVVQHYTAEVLTSTPSSNTSDIATLKSLQTPMYTAKRKHCDSCYLRLKTPRQIHDKAHLKPL